MAAEGSTWILNAPSYRDALTLQESGPSFHTGGQEGPALTVYLGAFKRSALERVGGYDGGLRAGPGLGDESPDPGRPGAGLVHPAMQVTYRPRSTVKALAKQYLHYGRWRREIMRQHRETVSLRYLAAPVAVAVITSGLAGPPPPGSPGRAGRGWVWFRPRPMAGTGVGEQPSAPTESARVRQGADRPGHNAHELGVGFLTSPKDLRP